MKKISIIIALIVLVFFCYIYTLNNKCVVTFDTDGGNSIKKISINRGETIKLPSNPHKKDYVFIEWQLDGKRFNNETKITKSIELKAKYVPEAYVKVTFDSMNETPTKSINIVPGNKIDKKQISSPIKEGYTFDGWYLEDNLFDFNQKITGNITLKAKYKSKELKVGDYVLIVGNYAASAYDTYGYHNKAIGWIRQILYIYNDTEHPYQVGLNGETTGFFKSDSLQLVDS